jgi:hypothetical protein
LDKNSSNKSDKKSTPPNKSNNSSSNSAPLKSNNSGTSNQKKSSPLADKLGKDGKLTPGERQRRLDNNLCLFCGKSGHIAKECPKSLSAASKAKAQAAKASEKPKK